MNRALFSFVQQRTCGHSFYKSPKHCSLCLFYLFSFGHPFNLFLPSSSMHTQLFISASSIIISSGLFLSLSSYCHPYPSIIFETKQWVVVDKLDLLKWTSFNKMQPRGGTTSGFDGRTCVSLPLECKHKQHSSACKRSRRTLSFMTVVTVRGLSPLQCDTKLHIQSCIKDHIKAP